jgi:hypothetical protein
VGATHTVLFDFSDRHTFVYYPRAHVISKGSPVSGGFR